MKERREIKALSVDFDLESSFSTASFTFLNQEFFTQDQSTEKDKRYLLLIEKEWKQHQGETKSNVKMSRNVAFSLFTEVSVSGKELL